MGKRIVLSLIVILAAVAALAAVPATQTPQTPPAPQPRMPVFVVIYERGSAWDDAKPAMQQTSIPEHRQFLATNLDKLLGAAPFLQGVVAGSSDRTVGMVMVNLATQEEAQALINADPAVSSNVMKATVRRWMVDRVKGY